MPQQELIDILKRGGVAVVRTDTLYGLLGRADSVSTIERIYKIKNRNPASPLIVLIDSLELLSSFSVSITEDQKEFLRQRWPGPVSVILPIHNLDEFEYLHRGTESVAFRIPDDAYLLELLRYTGPLVAPSANPEGFLPARDINHAREYFGDAVDYYDDRGVCHNDHASRLVSLREDGSLEVLRD